MDAHLSTVSRVLSPNWIGDLPIVGPEEIAIDHEAWDARRAGGFIRKAFPELDQGGGNPAMTHPPAAYGHGLFYRGAGCRVPHIGSPHGHT